VLGELQIVFRRHMEGIIARQLQQQIRLGRVLALGATHQVADQLDIVTLTELLQHLGGQVAVAIFHLVKVLHHMGLTGLTASPLSFYPLLL
jgi:hypothetical protein